MSYNCFQSHKDEIRQKYRNKYNNDFELRVKRREQRQ